MEGLNSSLIVFSSLAIVWEIIYFISIFSLLIVKDDYEPNFKKLRKFLNYILSLIKLLFGIGSFLMIFLAGIELFKSYTLLLNVLIFGTSLILYILIYITLRLLEGMAEKALYGKIL